MPFTDGLYVLLRPQGKKNKGHHHQQPRPPPHLQHLMMKMYPPESCPWSLSGPQFPPPTVIQQRYCYPRGRNEYASRKGGALWTMCDAAGKELTEFRLLHVYLSPKRAANKGVTLSKEAMACVPVVPKKRMRGTKPQHHPQHQHPMLPMRRNQATTTADIARDLSFCNSPLTLETLPPSPMTQDSPLSSDPVVPPPPRGKSPSDAFRSKIMPHNICQSPLQRSNIDPMFEDGMMDDPWMNLVLKPSLDTIDLQADDRQAFLGVRLETVAESLRVIVNAAPVSEQEHLMSLVRHWAQGMASDPLQQQHVPFPVSSASSSSHHHHPEESPDPAQSSLEEL